MERKDITKNILIKKYINEKKSITKIAEEMKCNLKTVYRALKRFNIPMINKDRGRYKKGKKHRYYGKKLPRKWYRNRKYTFKPLQNKVEKETGKPLKQVLTELYWGKILSIPKITKELGLTNYKTVHHWFKKFNIPTREMTGGWKNSDEMKKKLSRTLKEKYKNPELRQMFIKTLRKGIKKPTSLERIVLNIIKENNLPFKYVGDGSVFINRFNPDFIGINCNKVIEVFGEIFHLPPLFFGAFNKVLPFYRTEWGRKLYYKSRGFDCLIIWEHELKEDKDKCVKKVINFSLN